MEEIFSDPMFLENNFFNEGYELGFQEGSFFN